MKNQKTQTQRGLPRAHDELIGDQIPEDTVQVFDESPSMEFSDLKPNRRHAAIQSGLSYLDKRISQGAQQDRFAVVSFAEGARTECPFTTIDDIKRVKKAIKNMKIREYTNIHSGLIQAERLLLFDGVGPVLSLSRALRWLENKKVEDDSQRRKRIILLSDGCQNAGDCPLQVADRLKESGVEIDCIGIAGEISDPELDEEMLRNIASIDEQTGLPRYRFISETEQLVQHYQQLATGLTW